MFIKYEDNKHGNMFLRLEAIGTCFHVYYLHIMNCFQTLK
jgi:hypothetical protein